MLAALCPNALVLFCCTACPARAGLHPICSVGPSGPTNGETPSWPRPKLRVKAMPPPPVHQRESNQRRQTADIAEYTADGLRLKERVALELVDDSRLRTLVVRSAEPALVFFSNGSGECLLAEALLERSGAERQRQVRYRESDQLRIMKAPIATCGRLFAWTRSQGQPLSFGRFPACVLFVRGSPVSTLFGSFTQQELARFLEDGFSKVS